MPIASAANQQLPPPSGNRGPPASTAPRTRSIPNGYEGTGDLSTNEDDYQRSINVNIT